MEQRVPDALSFNPHQFTGPRCAAQQQSTINGYLRICQKVQCPRSFISTRRRIIQYNIWSLEIGFSCSHCLVLLVLMDRLQAVLWTDDYWVSLVKLIKEGSQGIFPKCVLWAQDFLALSLWIGVKCHEEISCYSHSLGSSHILNSSAAAF